MLKILLVFLGLSIVILYFGRKSYLKAENKQKEQNILVSNRLIHIGGLPNVLTNLPVLFEIKNNLIYLQAGNEIFTIDVDNVINCEIKNETQINNHPTITRMMTLGLFALAFPKKKIDTVLYLILSYKADNSTVDCVFRQSNFSQNMYEIPSIINKLRLN